MCQVSQAPLVAMELGAELGRIFCGGCRFEYRMHISAAPACLLASETTPCSEPASASKQRREKKSTETTKQIETYRRDLPWSSRRVLFSNKFEALKSSYSLGSKYHHDCCGSGARVQSQLRFGATTDPALNPPKGRRTIRVSTGRTRHRSTEPNETSCRFSSCNDTDRLTPCLASAFPKVTVYTR